MHHEIVGPEMNVITGQIRLPEAEAIARHVAQYTSFPGGEHVHELRKEAEALRAVREKRVMNIGHELIIHFLIAGNSEMALDVGLHTEQLESDHLELFKAMENLKNQSLKSDDRLWDGFHAVLKEVKRR